MQDFFRKEDRNIIDLDRLEFFNPGELSNSREYSRSNIIETLQATLLEGKKLLNAISNQLKAENFSLLEYTSHQLRGLFTVAGCERLAYLFEEFYQNLTKTRVEYLKNLVTIAKSELAQASFQIHDFLNSENQLLLAAV